jgi:hypothetical protein
MIRAIDWRRFIFMLGGAAIVHPNSLQAQQARFPTIGFLYPGAVAMAGTHIAALQQGLREVGQDQVNVEARSSEGDPTKLDRWRPISSSARSM